MDKGIPKRVFPNTIMFPSKALQAVPPVGSAVQALGYGEARL